MLILHNPLCAGYQSPNHPEHPFRVRHTAQHLKTGHPDWAFTVPTEPVPDKILLLAHTPAHLKRLEAGPDFDPDTPFYPGIATHARNSVSAALQAARHARHARSPVFSLMRPPGHHATADAAMGFCYLNQAAIAALFAQHTLGATRVAVWDFDAHHGNGIEAIFAGRSNLLYSSVHQSPGYPGTGLRDILPYARNWPIPPGTPRPVHMRALQASWDVVVGFRPDLIIVSAGFDAYARDPITTMTLETEDFATLGSWLRQCSCPVSAVLEGGYSPDLPLLIDAFLTAWDGSGKGAGCQMSV